jgi:hypothetical protein
MVLVHCTFSQCAWPFYEVVLNSNQLFSSYAPDEKNNGKVTKGNYSVSTLDRVMVLVHCTSSYCAWPYYEVVLNSNLYFSSYAPDMEKQQKITL